jgi:hypothetical protein
MHENPKYGNPFSFFSLFSLNRFAFLLSVPQTIHHWFLAQSGSWPPKKKTQDRLALIPQADKEEEVVEEGGISAAAWREREKRRRQPDAAAVSQWLPAGFGLDDEAAGCRRKKKKNGRGGRTMTKAPRLLSVCEGHWRVPNTCTKEERPASSLAGWKNKREEERREEWQLPLAGEKTREKKSGWRAVRPAEMKSPSPLPLSQPLAATLPGERVDKSKVGRR